MPNQHMNVANAGAFGFLALLVAIIGIASTIYWMYVAWRAMCAHERIAHAFERIADHQIAPIAKPIREQDR